MNLNNEKERFLNKTIFIYLLIYKTLIELLYIYFISPMFSYSGLYYDGTLLSYCISILSLIAITFLIPKDTTKVSSYIYLIFCVTNIIPAITFYWLNNREVRYVYILILFLLILSITLKLDFSPLNIRSYSAKFWINLLFLFYITITLLLVVRRGGVDLRALDFNSVYELRAENVTTGIWGYFLNWNTKALAPFFFGYFIYNKKRKMVFIVLLLQLLTYFSFGNKAFLFSIGVLILFTFLADREQFVKYYLLSMSFLNIIAYIFHKYFYINTLSRAIPYRLVFIPAQIQFQYYDFFKNKDKLFFADGLIGKFLSIKSPYNGNISNVIGMHYSHNGLGSNSNTGIISDAYANGGTVGVVIISFIFGVLLLIINSSSLKLPLSISIGILSYITFVLNDTGLLTTLFTGGLGLIIILLFLFNSSINQQEAFKNKSPYMYKAINKKNI